MKGMISLSPLDYGAMLLYLLGVLAMGFYFMKNEGTSEEYLLGGRRMPWLAVGISCMMSLLSTFSLVMVPGEIYNHGLSLWMLGLLAALAFGLAASSIFPALMMGIFSKRVNSKGAVAGMLVGVISTAVYIFLYLGWFFIPGTASIPNTPDQWWMGISPQAFGAVGAILNFAVAYAVSMATEAPPQEIQDLVESVRTPKGAGVALDH